MLDASAVLFSQGTWSFVFCVLAFSGSFLDAQSFCEQDVQPLLVFMSSLAGIKPIMAVTDFLGNNRKLSVTCRPICSVLIILAKSFWTSKGQFP